MRLFNAQNHSSGYRHPVFLNITSKDCETFEFREEVKRDWGLEYVIAPSRKFIRADKDLRFINYAYAGGVNKCNYDMVKTTREGKTYFTYTLAKSTHPSIQEKYDQSQNLLWDFGHAIFKNGSPVIQFQLVFDISGEVYSHSFTSLYDLRSEGDIIRFLSESDHYGTTYRRPDQVNTSSSVSEDMTINMAFDYQNPNTDILRRVVRGLRTDIDEVAGVRSTEPICWFLKNMGEIMAFIMVLDSSSLWDMNALGHTREYNYSGWFSDKPYMAYEYIGEIFPGYKGLDL